jgi:hypothetical protein
VTPASCSTSATFTSTDEVRELVAAFEAGTLPKEMFTHRAHLTVALWYLVWYGPDAATERVRDAITQFNRVHGALSRPGGGYHETITRFYMWAVRRHLRAAPLEGSLADLANDVAAALADRALPLRYYSRERLMSDDARLRWVEPDLEPLDHFA